MTNELDHYGHLPITLQFVMTNPAANTTTDAILDQGGTGFVVPTGYKFQPLMLYVESNEDLTAGTADFGVTDDGVEISGGPAIQLADTVQRGVGVARIGVSPIAADAVVGVSGIMTAAYAPVTADHDIVLTGVLTPA